VVAQLTAAEADRLALRRGQSVSLDLSRRRSFEEAAANARSSVA
jgi:hypothetical protein